MDVGLIGFPLAGKSTLFAAVSHRYGKGDVAAVPVPDPRFDAIVAQVKPKKVTPAAVILRDDVEDVQSSGKLFSQRFLDAAKRAQVLLHVVRAFESPMAPYHAEVDPKRDFEAIEVELVLADLQVIENRLERLQKSMTVRQPGSADYLERQLFEKIKPELEEGRALRSLELDEAEQGIVRNYQFLSSKPLVAAINVGEAEAAAPSTPAASLKDSLRGRGIPAFVVCATIEHEIAQLDPADQPEFLSSLGLEEPASARLIRAVYDALGLITFFTAGESETRAWPLRRGSTALKAAATIHTDIARGFIRAEVTSYADYAAHGSLDAAESAGKMRLEGKDYVVQDGDLLHIRNKS
jgi:ribosome-binding ATPase